MATDLPRRLWPEGVAPTAEEFATWSRGVFLAQLVPVLQRLFEAVERGERCLIEDHENTAALTHARWHRALDNPWREPQGPIQDHILQHDDQVRAALGQRLRSLASDWQANGGSRELGDPTDRVWHDCARQLLEILDGEASW